MGEAAAAGVSPSTLQRNFLAQRRASAFQLPAAAAAVAVGAAMILALCGQLGRRMASRRATKRIDERVRRPRRLPTPSTKGQPARTAVRSHTDAAGSPPRSRRWPGTAGGHRRTPASPRLRPPLLAEELKAPRLRTRATRPIGTWPTPRRHRRQGRSMRKGRPHFWPPGAADCSVASRRRVVGRQLRAATAAESLAQWRQHCRYLLGAGPLKSERSRWRPRPCCRRGARWRPRPRRMGQRKHRPPRWPASSRTARLRLARWQSNLAAHFQEGSRRQRCTRRGDGLLAQSGAGSPPRASNRPRRKDPSTSHHGAIRTRTYCQAESRGPAAAMPRRGGPRHTLTSAPTTTWHHGRTKGDRNQAWRGVPERGGNSAPSRTLSRQRRRRRCAGCGWHCPLE